MPIITSDTVQKDSGDGIDDPCGPYAAELYSDTGGLTQFRAFVEILPPRLALIRQALAQRGRRDGLYAGG